MRIRVPIVIDGQTHQATLGDLRRLLRAKGDDVERADAVQRILVREAQEITRALLDSEPPPPNEDEGHG